MSGELGTLEMQSPGARLAGWGGRQRPQSAGVVSRVSVRGSVSVCPVYVSACMHVHACVHVCTRMREHVHTRACVRTVHTCVHVLVPDTCVCTLTSAV